MQRISTTFLLLLTLSGLALITGKAQAISYVSDQLSVPLRSGPGNNYRIVHKGLPSGTRMTTLQTSDDGTFTEVQTPRGTRGWMRSQYLITEMPAKLKLDSALARLETANTKNSQLTEQLRALQSESSELKTQAGDTDQELERISTAYADLKKISDGAVQLDIDNRRLVQESEVLKSDLERIKAENQRLSDKLNSSAFMDGALAVLLGVLIALLVPRLRPNKRRDSGWA